MIVIKERKHHLIGDKWWVGIQVSCTKCRSDLILEEKDTPMPDGSCAFGYISKWICPVCGESFRKLTGT